MAASENNVEYDVAIVGGGAAGLAAAIFTAENAGDSPRRKIVILDGASRLGAKILVSGGGRCNVTHDVVSSDDFNGPKNIVRNVLASFGVDATTKWFASLGVELKREETGKLFPTTDSAKTILNALLRRCEELGVEIRSSCRVNSITLTPSPGTPGEGGGEGSSSRTSGAVLGEGALSVPQNPLPNLLPEYREKGPEKQAFEIDFAGGKLFAHRVILATGGRSLPRTGSDGGGWKIAQSLGHSVTETYQSLVPLVLDQRMFHAELSGIALEVELSTFAENKLIDRRRGSLLFTHFGISGPVVMDASRHWVIAKETGKSPQMKCNFLIDEDFESTENWLIDRAKSNPKSQLITTLAQRFPERVAATMLKYLDLNPTQPLSQLSREARRTLVHALTALDLKVLGPRGWNYAEVTAGGVPLAEVNHRTMESRKSPGIYLVGEMLDCEGRIGGFNFQWAWATGHLAGRAVAATCSDESKQ